MFLAYWKEKSENTLENNTTNALLQHVAYPILHNGTFYLHFSKLSAYFGQLLDFLKLIKFLFGIISIRLHSHNRHELSRQFQVKIALNSMSLRYANANTSNSIVYSLHRLQLLASVEFASTVTLT